MATTTPRLSESSRIYLLTILSCLGAIGLEFLLARLTNIELPLLILLSGVFLSAVYGGLGPGLLATLLTLVAADYFFLTPGYLATLDAATLARLSIFTIECLAITLVCETHRRTRQENQRLNQDMQGRIDALELAQTAVREGELRFRTLIECSRDGIGVAHHGKILYVNQAYADLLGYTSPEEMVGLSVLDIVHPDDRPMLAGRRERRAAGIVEPTQYQYRALRRDGTILTVENNISSYASGEEFYTVVITRDITARNRAEEALRSSERLMRLIMNAAPVLIAYFDPAERYRFHNQTYARWFGNDCAEITGKSADEVLGTAASEQLRPYRQSALSGEPVRYEGIVPFANGGSRYIQSNYVPDIDRDGTVRGCVFVAADVTATKRQEEAQRFLAQVSETLSASLDYKVTLAQVANTVIPHFADWCAVDILENGALQRVAIAHVDPERRQHGEETHRQYPPHLEDTTGPGYVIRTGQTEHVREITNEILRAVTPDEVRYQALKSFGLASYICVPLVARERTIGAITLLTTEAHRLYSPEDVLLAENLAHRAALAVDNARLYAEAQAEIHERKQVQQEIQSLNIRLQRAMAETHHRVKNNLQVISAMIDLQVIDRPETLPASEFARLSQHVRTLASVHELLTEQAKTDGEAHHISAKQVLGKLLPMLRNTAGKRRIEFELEDALLTSRQATSLALVTNEICSNAVKHGGTMVHIVFRVAENRAILTVSDNGTGFPKTFNPQANGNTGLDLLHTLTGWDLNGDITFENRPEGGGRVTVTFPLANITPLIHAEKSLPLYPEATVREIFPFLSDNNS